MLQQIAFDGGAVMGLSVASLGLIGVGYLLGIFNDPAKPRSM